MNKLFLLIGLLLCGFTAYAQDVPLPKLDGSPLDVVYYPLNATKVKDAKTALPVMRVLYSRPQKKGREIFGTLEQYGKVWRVGANESTELDVFKNVRMNGKRLQAGRYSLFAIPNRDKWTIIVNKDVDRWGAYSYDAKHDVMRVDVPVRRTGATVEALTLTFRDTNEGANLVIVWDRTQVEVPFQITK